MKMNEINETWAKLGSSRCGPAASPIVRVPEGKPCAFASFLACLLCFFWTLLTEDI